jgi:hypothetical protein
MTSRAAGQPIDDAEAERVVGQQAVLHAHRAPCAVHGLPGHGRAFDHAAEAGGHVQVARGRDRQPFHAVVAHANPPPVGAGGHFEVVFQLPVAAVVDEVDARVEPGVAHGGEVAHVGAPRGGVVAEVVVAVVGGGRVARQPGRGCGAGKRGAQGQRFEGLACQETAVRGAAERAGCRRPRAAGLDRAPPGQEAGHPLASEADRGAGNAAGEAGGRRPLAQVFREAERQAAEGGGQSGARREGGGGRSFGRGGRRFQPRRRVGRGKGQESREQADRYQGDPDAQFHVRGPFGG